MVPFELRRPGWSRTFCTMRITPGTIALITLGDAALVLGALGLGGLIALGAPLATGLIALGVVGNALGIVRLVRAARRP